MARILVTGHWFVCGSPRIIAETYTKLGHEVVSAGPSYGKYIPWGAGLVLDDEYVPTEELGWQNEVTVGDLEARYGKFDVTIQCDAQWYMRRAESPCVIFASDNHVLNYPHIDDCDIFYGAHSWAQHAGHPKFRWMPGAWEVHCFDLGLARRFDVAIVGAMYESRKAAVNFLIERGVTFVLATGLIGEQFNYAYNVAKMALVLSCNNDLSGRVFNHMRQGCLVIAERGVKDMDRIGMRSRVHYLDFGDEYEMFEAIRIGREPRFRKVITDFAKVWVEPHSWTSRLQAILDDVGKLGG